MAELTKEQISKVSQWVKEGASLSIIQGKLSSEFKISMTFLDVRFLVDDLNLTLQEKEEPKKPDEVNAVTDLNSTNETIPPSPVATGVSVEVDTICRPGTMVSGNVTFSDNQKADWYLDMEGRPGLVPRTQGYRPTRNDIIDFQQKLDAALRQSGF
jgi:hypothetical protein